MPSRISLVLRRARHRRRDLQCAGPHPRFGTRFTARCCSWVGYKPYSESQPGTQNGASCPPQEHELEGPVTQVRRPAARSLGGKPPLDWLLKRLDKSRGGLESRFMRPRQVAPHTIGTRSRWPTLEILGFRGRYIDRANQRPPDGEVLEVIHLMRQMNRDYQAAPDVSCLPKLDSDGRRVRLGVECMCGARSGPINGSGTRSTNAGLRRGPCFCSPRRV